MICCWLWRAPAHVHAPGRGCTARQPQRHTQGARPQPRVLRIGCKWQHQAAVHLCLLRANGDGGGPVHDHAMYTMTGKRYSRAPTPTPPMCGGAQGVHRWRVRVAPTAETRRSARRTRPPACTFGAAAGRRGAAAHARWRTLTCACPVRARARHSSTSIGSASRRWSRRPCWGVKSIIQGRLLTSPEDKFDSLTLLCARRRFRPCRRQHTRPSSCQSVTHAGIARRARRRAQTHRRLPDLPAQLLRGAL